MFCSFFHENQGDTIVLHGTMTELYFTNPILKTKADISFCLDNLSGQEIVSCIGIVKARRSQKSILYVDIDIVDCDVFDSTQSLPHFQERAKLVDTEIQLVVSTTYAQHGIMGDPSNLRKGAIVKCSGYPSSESDRPSCLSVHVDRFALERCSPDPTAITRLLKAIVAETGLNGPIPSGCGSAQLRASSRLENSRREDWCRVLHCTPEVLQDLLGLLNSAFDCSAVSLGTTLSRAVGMQSRVIAGRAARRARKREMHVKPADMVVLKDAESNCADWLYAGECVSFPSSLSSSVDVSVGGVDANVECDCSGCTAAQGQHLPEGAEYAPSARGPLSRGQYLHGKKLPQVRWLVARLGDMHRRRHGSSLAGVRVRGSGFKHYLDIGGGRGDLAFSIAQTYSDCIVTMVDRNSKSLLQAEERAVVLGIRDRMRFVCVSLLSTTSPENAGVSGECVQPATGSAPASASAGAHRYASCSTRELADLIAHDEACTDPVVDCVVALHACGGLTDLALQFAALNSCCFLAVPCCYVKIPIMPSSWARVRVHHSGNVGYLNSTQRSVLLHLAESSTRDISLRASRIVNSERLAAVESIVGDTAAISLTMEYFPSSYSLRNAVMVGQR